MRYPVPAVSRRALGVGAAGECLEVAAGIWRELGDEQGIARCLSDIVLLAGRGAVVSRDRLIGEDRPLLRLADLDSVALSRP